MVVSWIRIVCGPIGPKAKDAILVSPTLPILGAKYQLWNPDPEESSATNATIWCIPTSSSRLPGMSVSVWKRRVIKVEIRPLVLSNEERHIPLGLDLQLSILLLLHVEVSLGKEVND